MKNLGTIYPAVGTSALHPQEACEPTVKGVIIEFPKSIAQHEALQSNSRSFESIEGIPFGTITRVQAIVSFSVAVALSFIVAVI